MKAILQAYILLILCVITKNSSSQQFQQAYGGASYDIALSARPTSDNGFVIAGYTQSFGLGTQDVYLVKVSPNGDTLWTRTYGSNSFNEAASSVEQTRD